MNVLELPISPVNIEDRKKWDIRPGDTVKVWQKIKEKDKTRLQLFEGLVLARKHGKTAGGTFTVRAILSGVGVEKIFPLYSPFIDKVEVVKRAKVRRAKLYHIRDIAAKEISSQMRKLRALPDRAPEEKVEKTEEKKTEKTEKIEEAAKTEKKEKNQK